MRSTVLLSITTLFACSDVKPADTAGVDDASDAQDEGAGEDFDGSVLVGKVYAIDLTEGRFVGAEDLGPALGAVIEYELLAGITDASEGIVDVLVGMGTDGEQDLCQQTIDLPPGDRDDRYIEVGPADVTYIALDQTYHLLDFELAGTVSTDLTAVEDIVAAATMDVREGEEYWGMGADQLCELIESQGLPCRNCSDGQPFCIDFVIDQLTAPEVPGPVVEIDASTAEACDG